MHDLVHLERRGIPAVGIATAPFADEAIEQARRLGMPGARMVYVPHPVQLLTDDELDARADAIFPDVLAALTSGKSDQWPGGTASLGNAETWRRCPSGYLVPADQDPWHRRGRSHDKPGSTAGDE